MNALFYIAFIKRYHFGCQGTDEDGNADTGDQYSCHNELSRQLLINMLVMFSKNGIEIGMPLFKKCFNRGKKRKLYLKDAKKPLTIDE